MGETGNESEIVTLCVSFNFDFILFYFIFILRTDCTQAFLLSKEIYPGLKFSDNNSKNLLLSLLAENAQNKPRKHALVNN